MEPYNLNPRMEALRWLGIAEKLLTTRDLVGSKTFATRAREADPSLELADQILAIVDTLIASETPINNYNLDWYAILQLGRRTHDTELIATQYRRLALLLNPNRNSLPFAEHAFKLVSEAWLVLSNPGRKFQFDNEFANYNIAHFNFAQQVHSNPQHQPLPQHQQQPQPLPPFPQQLFPSPQPQQPHSPPQHQPPYQQQLFPPPQQPTPLRHQQYPHSPPHQQQGQPLFQHPGQHSNQQPQQPLIQQQRQASNQQEHQPSILFADQQQQIPSNQQKQTPSAQQQRKPLTQQEPPPNQHEHQPSNQQQPLSNQKQHNHLNQQQQIPSNNQQQTASALQQPHPLAQQQDPSNEQQHQPSSQQQQQAVSPGNDNHTTEVEDPISDNVNSEESSTFWTACPYCYYMYEYPGAYADCSLRCQNCKRAFHAVTIAAPPPVSDGKEAYFCCWGFFPFGVSMSNLEKNKGWGSNWTPFSSMFTYPQWANNMNVGKPRDGQKSSAPRMYIDDDQDDFMEISSSDDSDDDWRSTRKKKKAKRAKGKVSAAIYGKQEVDKAKIVKGSNGENLQGGFVAEEGVRAGVANVPVAETTKKRGRPPKRRQSGRVAKDLGKLDLNVEFNNEVEEPATGTSGANRKGNEEDNMEGIGFFEGLDEFLSSLPILSVVGDDKVKAG